MWINMLPRFDSRLSSTYYFMFCRGDQPLLWASDTLLRVSALESLDCVLCCLCAVEVGSQQQPRLFFIQLVAHYLFQNSDENLSLKNQSLWMQIKECHKNMWNLSLLFVILLFCIKGCRLE